MDTLSPQLDQCLLHAEHVRNLSLNYITSVRSTFKIFLRDTGIRHVEECTRDAIENWLLMGRIDHKWRPATFRSYHRNLGFFFRWLVKKGKLGSDPTEGIELPKLGTVLPKGLSREDAELVLTTVKRMKFTFRFEERRNLAVIALMLFTGLRKQEVANLTLEDVDFSRMLVSVIQGKGKKDRIVPISTRLAVILKEYLKDRERLGKRSENLFTTAQKDRPMGTQCIDNLIDRIKEKSGLKFSPHSLRHTFATLMLEGGCDIYTLSKMMGHSKINTTTVYLSCSPRMMMSSIERHPLN